MMVDFQSHAGPGDKGLRNTELEGYQPVSRIGEVVMNAFVDSYEFTLIKDALRADELKGDPANAATDIVEYKPHFHEWATVQPGMVCLARKKRTAVFRQYVAAETAVPVIACAACLPAADEKNYFFAGVARSKSVRDPDDGVGPKTDEFFTGTSRPVVKTLVSNPEAPANVPLLVCVRSLHRRHGHHAQQLGPAHPPGESPACLECDTVLPLPCATFLC